MKIIPELKGYIPFQDFELFKPDDPYCFNLSVEFLIGEKNKKGSDAFKVNICTPMWLTQQLDKQKIISGYGYLICEQYNFSEIENFLKAYISECGAETWEDAAWKLCKLGEWEFDYRFRLKRIEAFQKTGFLWLFKKYLRKSSNVEN